ncbi:hypothetical protein Aph01nite_43080 [Acrocarpospora phusangensis]|uniref:Uncharacterized protein n=1 Tax=Acrocarpospora phusangensis TaxID=1070424 RepID=A0A919UQ34_9ACTN|nr:hypothetical protein [Acrocarpospora phusangensis]GIH25998.1 hypothetical protein Aph01nite_43080 [Acrocarpospora phusangensis]
MKLSKTNPLSGKTLTLIWCAAAVLWGAAVIELLVGVPSRDILIVATAGALALTVIAGVAGVALYAITAFRQAQCDNREYVKGVSADAVAEVKEAIKHNALEEMVERLARGNALAHIDATRAYATMEDQAQEWPDTGPFSTRRFTG